MEEPSKNLVNNKYLDVGYFRFLDAASLSSDEVTMILKTHLLAEYYLDQILLCKLPRGGILNELSFYNKILVVESLDFLSKPLIDAIKNLNSVRNGCAHTLNYEISEKDIDKIGNPFGQEYVKIKRDHFKNNRELLHWTMAKIIAPLDGCLGDHVRLLK